MSDRITIPLRIAPELHAQLKLLADVDERSLNGYIGRVLAHHVARTSAVPGQVASVSLQSQRLPVPSKVRNVGPNERCPCGSGAKYKRCHGRAKG